MIENLTGNRRPPVARPSFFLPPRLGDPHTPTRSDRPTPYPGASLPDSVVYREPAPTPGPTTICKAGLHVPRDPLDVRRGGEEAAIGSVVGGGGGGGGSGGGGGGGGGGEMRTNQRQPSLSPDERDEPPSILRNRQSWIYRGSLARPSVGLPLRAGCGSPGRSVDSGHHRHRRPPDMKQMPATASVTAALYIYIPR